MTVCSFLVLTLLNEFAGPDNLVNLKKIAQQFQRQQSAGAEDEDDDEVPDLVEGESFEEASKQEVAA
jgi:nascent polypeptide-associated complex subunit beta